MLHAIRSAVLLVAGSALSASSFAQCAYSTSMVDTFIATGNPLLNSDQHAQSGWTYERTGASGAERILLTGVTGSWTGGAWGSPSQAFFVPLAGPVYSPNVSLNQIPFFRRTPSFTGLMLHPGFGADHARAVLTPQSAAVLSSFVVQVELLGNFSPNVIVSATLQRASGGSLTLIAPTSVAALAAAVSLSPGSGVLPLALAAGDRVIVETADGGSPSEDWANVNATAGLSGRPLIATQPLVHANCNDDTTATVVAAGATSYRWRRAGIDLNIGATGTGSVISGVTSPSLHITAFGYADDAIYDCVVTNGCGSVVSAQVPITLCFADVNCDGGVDGDDVIVFFQFWDASDARGDFNQDGGVDGDDVIAFFERWDSGC